MPRVSTIAWVALLVCTGWLGYDKWANRTDPEPAPIVDGVSIEGPDRVEVKELFFLTVKGRIGADTKTLNLPKSVKAMLLKDFAGNLVYACQAIEAGQCLFIVADNADGKTLFGAKTVTAGTPTPPVPPPPPPPPPAPTFPDEQLGYSTAIYKAASVVVDDARAATAKSLASNFSGIASMIAAGTMPNAQAILAETKKRNEATAGPKRTAWLAAFTALKAKLDADGFDGSKPRPVSDYKQAWEEIAAGLGAVK